MDRDREASLVERVLAHVHARTTDADGETAHEQPARDYVDDARHAREVDALFHSLPVAIAHRSALPSPGSFLTHDASGVPLLVTRGEDGVVRAFLNVCRHRGTRVESLPCGQKKTFVCPYHAWSYANDGELRGLPHDRGFSGLDRRARALVQVPAGEAAGLVFVSPRPSDTALDLHAWLGELEDDLAYYGLASGHVYDPRDYVRELNWKLAIDIFLETYHLRTAHKESIYPLFFDNLGLVDRVGAHLRNVFPKRSIRELEGTDRTTWSLRKHANVLFHVFPNTLVLVEPDHAAVLHIWPLGRERTRLTTYTIVPEPADTDKARRYWDANNAILYGATDEDFALGASIQKGLASLGDRTVLFGAFEHALTHFHAQIDERVRT